MAGFDIIDAAGNGYRTVWDERAYLLRLAAVPVLIKLICHVIVFSLGWQDQFFRQTLVMLPSFFADGWMLAHVIRLIFLGQRWPYRPTGDETKDMKTLESRARGIMAGTLTFTVIRFLLAGIMALFLTSGQQSGPPSETAAMQEPAGPGIAVMAIMLLIFSIWAFRFMWYYIPAALNYPLRRFTADLGGFKTSFYMIGTWLVGYVPIFFILVMVSSTLLQPYKDDLSQIPVITEFALGLFNIAADTLIVLITTTGMAAGIRQLMQGNKKA
ncbi:MAG: hypothetical protein H6868_00495 [Rhodospirillales bacterium]|nr:hypothetical protein [Rhodospirillales bacterium]